MFDNSAIINFFVNLSGDWAVFFLSMIPITETRVSVPLGIEFFSLPIWKVWIMAIIGNIIPAIFILYLMPLFHDWILKQKFIGLILKNKLKKAEKAFSGKYAKYGAAALIIFVAIPLPFTGVWTGSLAAFIFNIPFKKSLPLIFCGAFIAIIIITLVTLFAGTTLRAIF